VVCVGVVQQGLRSLQNAASALDKLAMRDSLSPEARSMIKQLAGYYRKKAAEVSRQLNAAVPK